MEQRVIATSEKLCDFRNKTQLEDVSFAKWNKVQANITENLIKSMPDRFKAVIKMQQSIRKRFCFNNLKIISSLP